MIGIIICTTECNLRCKYCFEENEMKSMQHVPLTVINEHFFRGNEVWKKFGSELIAYNRDHGMVPEFTFHGGEPLLIYPEYIDELCGYYRAIDNRCKFNIQTNGTLVNDKILSVLVKYNFRVGVSIDGCEQTNDENRITMSGKGTHSIILDNIKKLKDTGLVVGAMATITDSITQDVAKFYNFYKENLSVGFNACYSSPNTDGHNKINDKDYCNFLTELFELWISDDDSSIMIQPFERIIRNMVRPSAGMGVCQFIEDCRGVNIAINSSGDIYQCLHYCNLKDSSMGNIMDCSLVDIIESNYRRKGHWERLIEGKTLCKDCDIYNYCYGGCPYWSDAKEITGMERDFSCYSQKYIVHYIYNRLKNR